MIVAPWTATGRSLLCLLFFFLSCCVRRLVSSFVAHKFCRHVAAVFNSFLFVTVIVVISPLLHLSERLPTHNAIPRFIRIALSLNLAFFLFFSQISAVTSTTSSGVSSELVIRPSASDHGSVFRCHVLHPALAGKPYEVSFTLQVLCKFFCIFSCFLVFLLFAAVISPSSRTDGFSRLTS